MEYKLTIDNLEEVAAQVARTLEGHTYTFYTHNLFFGPDHSEERKGQRLAPESTVHKKAVWTWKNAHPDGNTYGGFHVSDSYGVWGASTFSDATIIFVDACICIFQTAGAGHRIEWTLRLED